MPDVPRPRALIALFAAVVLAACREVTDALPAKGLVLCTPPLQVTADTRGAAPRFSWSPTCGATYLEVTSPDGQDVFWIVQGDTGKIAPGVVYGIAPPAYESRFGPMALESGRRYLVRVGLMVEENSFAVVGEQTFTR